MRRTAAENRRLGDESKIGVPETLRERVRAQLRRRERPRDAVKLPALAGGYLLVIGATAIAAATLALSQFGPEAGDWTTFAALAVAAALAQLFVVRTPRNQSYQTTMVFVVAAALVLPPELVALVPVVAYVPEWVRERYRWPVPTFNIFNYTLSALAAAAVMRFAVAGGAPAPTLRWAVAGLVAGTAFMLLNHLLLATMIRVAHGHSFRSSGLFARDSLSADLVLALFGLSIAGVWSWNPWLVPAALAPLVLMHRSLAVPTLQEQARVDPKTGLFNARHFNAVFEEELSRARRFERPLSLLVADLDLLRDINNTHGHLAGDAVLVGIAQLFREQLRDYDVPSRFGGEEFAIVLPETTTHDAVTIAERIRRSLASTQFVIANGQAPIRATISIGVAGFPRDGADARELIMRADEAVYRAKLEGRNRVVDADAAEGEDVPAPHLTLLAAEEYAEKQSDPGERAVS
jgi:diguanylate cyclase (GGDEF)-like protein